MNNKKKVLIHTNSHSAFTGFGKNCKNILRYLHSTGKYELIEFANGVVWGNEEDSFPWKVFGSLPNDVASINRINSDEQTRKIAQYGLLTIDRVIETVKPDVYIGIEDIWAFNETVKKPWWNKINCMIWTTLDSLPILPDAINNAPRIKNYYCWSKFAETALKKQGVAHIKTLHGSIDESHFSRLSEEERSGLRRKFGIPEDTFIAGFVFRNQLRKTVGDLITGLKIFKMNFPEVDAKILLHTNWAEGWDIPRLLRDNGLDLSNVLTTYICGKCKNYLVSKFAGNEARCPYCGQEKSLSTISVTNGVSETHLNEIYNLMDVYVHPFTSGGQEIPIQEAKLTELITLVTNYTCGEEMCTAESGGIPLAWAPYREFGTQFIKASTSPADIAQKLHAVYSMSKEKRREMGAIARKYVIDNYSFASIGAKLEKIIDEMPDVKFDFSHCSSNPNPSYKPKKQYPSDVEFVKDLYRGILDAEVDASDQGLIHWVTRLRNGESQDSIVSYFRSVAQTELSKKNPPKIEDLIGNDKSPKIALVVPSDSFVSLLCGYFIEEIARKFPSYHLYVFAEPKLHQTLYGYSSKIYKLLPKLPICDSQNLMEGIGSHGGHFDVCFTLNRDELNASLFSHNTKA
jgi:glycosyltransferase involved in cell wall biosynthesis